MTLLPFGLSLEAFGCCWVVVGTQGVDLKGPGDSSGPGDTEDDSNDVVFPEAGSL